MWRRDGEKGEYGLLAVLVVVKNEILIMSAYYMSACEFSFDCVEVGDVIRLRTRM